MYRILQAVGPNVDRARQSTEMIVDLPAASDEIEVLLLNVFEEFEVTGEGAQVESTDFYDETDAPESVDVATTILKRAGITTRTRREYGDPTETILSVANQEDVDAIAMSGRKRSPAGKVLFGSVTQSVLLSADQPVMITTP